MSCLDAIFLNHPSKTICQRKESDGLPAEPGCERETQPGRKRPEGSSGRREREKRAQKEGGKTSEKGGSGGEEEQTAGKGTARKES